MIAMNGVHRQFCEQGSELKLFVEFPSKQQLSMATDWIMIFLKIFDASTQTLQSFETIYVRPDETISDTIKLVQSGLSWLPPVADRGYLVRAFI